MAQITTAAIAARDLKVYVGGITPFYYSFSPTVIAATVTNADRILIATLPANARVIGGAVRMTGTSGVTAIVSLQVVEPTGNTIVLSPTSGAASAPSVAFSTYLTQPHSPITSVTATRDLEIVCSTGSISVTNGLLWIVEADFAFFP